MLATEAEMRLRLTPIAAAALAAAIALPAIAQWINYPTPGIPRLANGKPNLSAPTPRTADGKPDLSGVWQAGRAGEYGYDYNVAQNLKPEDVQPWAEAVRLQRVQDFRKDSPLARCLPVSVPFLNFRGLSRIVQTPGLIVILYESPNSPHRTIFTDGRDLPKDLNPTCSRSIRGPMSSRRDAKWSSRSPAISYWCRTAQVHWTVFSSPAQRLYSCRA